MNYKELQDFIKEVANSGATEVKIESKELKLTIKRQTINPEQQVVVSHQQVAPAPQVAVEPQATVQTETKEVAAPTPVETTNTVTIKAPMVGTFYSKPNPEKPPFVKVGDELAPGKIICIIEAMKLFNEIESEVSGKIVKVLLKDGSPVEYDQDLFVVELT